MYDMLYDDIYNVYEEIVYKSKDNKYRIRKLSNDRKEYIYLLEVRKLKLFWITFATKYGHDDKKSIEDLIDFNNILNLMEKT